MPQLLERDGDRSFSGEPSRDIATVRRERITRTAISGVLAKGAAFLPTLGIAPIAASILKPERLGILMTLSSLLAFLAMADLGIGGNLVTSVSRSFGAERHFRVRVLISNGLALICAISALISLLSVGLAFTKIGTWMFPLSTEPVQVEASYAVAIFGIAFALSMPLTMLAKVQLGLQMGHIANRWQAAGYVMNFLAGALCCRLTKSVPITMLGLQSGSLTCGALNSFFLLRSQRMFGFLRRGLRRKAAYALLAGSVSYLAMQVIAVVSYASDTLIVAHKLGAQEATGYAIAERLFSIVAAVIAVFTGPLWAAYGEAFGRKNYEWARRCLWTSARRFILLSGSISACLLLFFHPVSSILTSKVIVIPITLAVMMAVWRVIEALGNALSVYFLAGEAVGFVICCGTATAAVSFILKVLLVNRFGPLTMPAATLLSFTLLTLVPSLVYVRKKQSQEAFENP